MFSKSSLKDRADQGQAQGRNTEIILAIVKDYFAVEKILNLRTIG
jgi:hypothetical protein